jgi:hypothetical protein
MLRWYDAWAGMGRHGQTWAGRNAARSGFCATTQTHRRHRLAALPARSTRALSYGSRESHLAVAAHQSHVLPGFVMQTCYPVSDRDTGDPEIDVVEFLAYLCAIHGHAAARAK